MSVGPEADLTAEAQDALVPQTDEGATEDELGDASKIQEGAGFNGDGKAD